MIAPYPYESNCSKDFLYEQYHAISTCGRRPRARLAFAPGERGKIDDAALSGLDQLRPSRPRHPHHGGHVDVDNLLPKSAVNVRDAAPANDVARGVDEHIQSAEKLGGGGDQSAGGSFLREIRLKNFGFAAGFRGEGLELFRAGLARMIMDGNVGSRRNELLNDGLTEALAAARDQYAFVL